MLFFLCVRRKNPNSTWIFVYGFFIEPQRREGCSYCFFIGWNDFVCRFVIIVSAKAIPTDQQTIVQRRKKTKVSEMRRVYK